MLIRRKKSDKIKLERIPSQELDMVRNYLLGRILNFVDGPFNASRLIKSILLSDLDKSYFEKLVGTIRDISSEELRDLANKYLIPENMWSITVGK
jgi:predicted Zn-dependent peptidase